MRRRSLRRCRPGLEGAGQVDCQQGYIQQADAQVAGAWRDHADRLVVEFDSDYRSHGTAIAAEWPIGLPAGWTDATVIAADPQASTSAFALTPMPDGNIRVDPLSNRGDEPGYTWGYRGGGPTTFYQALVRCALGMWAISVGVRSLILVRGCTPWPPGPWSGASPKPWRTRLIRHLSRPCCSSCALIGPNQPTP
ncbi:hypothetical protein GCM10023334_087680 [Nonomuraea thailandensis]